METQFGISDTTPPKPRPSEELPDTQNRGADSIAGARVALPQVGIANLRLPLSFGTETGPAVTLEASATATVALHADSKGINMSRLVRELYAFRNQVFWPETLGGVLGAYRESLRAPWARLKLSFRYPLLQTSLRSGLAGFQYYDCAYEATANGPGVVGYRLHFDYLYSSACPASDELAEHAERERGVHAIPHSQRSRARLVVVPADVARLRLEDLQRLCRRALPTETLVIVRREDEQAFAELNGAHPVFVEDAARLLYEQLAADARIADFRLSCSHYESLHNHDAVAVVAKGITGGLGTDDEFQ